LLNQSFLVYFSLLLEIVWPLWLEFAQELPEQLVLLLLHLLSRLHYLSTLGCSCHTFSLVRRFILLGLRRSHFSFLRGVMGPLVFNFFFLLTPLLARVQGFIPPVDNRGKEFLTRHLIVALPFRT